MSRNYRSDGTENYKPARVRVVNGIAIEESDIEVHRFLIGDTDEPTIVAGFELAKWQQTEAAEWVRAHCIGELYWISGPSTDYYHICYRVMARLTKKDQTFFKLKYQ